MPAAIGGLIIVGLEAAGVTGVAGLGLASTTIFGVSLGTILGTAAVIGASIGLQYALRPDIPKPSDGSQPVKQAIPPRIMGYGRNRLAGYYMLFEQFNGVSYDVMAFHSGRIGGIIKHYFSDDPIQVVGGVVYDGGDGRYSGSRIFIDSRLGTDDPAPSSFYMQDGISQIWTSEHLGRGIAWASLICGGVPDPKDFTMVYPRGLPTLSVVADCAPIWDPRDLAQSRFDESSWQVSYNPVIQLLDYLTRVDGGLGLDFDIIFTDEALAQWMAEADLCDDTVPDAAATPEPRYRCNGWFTFDTGPENVINNILATCDGWLAETGDGTFTLTVGMYREPTVILNANHIIGFGLNFGQTDEQTVNQIDVSYTEPDPSYIEVQGAPWRDEQSISDTGIIRAQQLNLKWTQSNSQAQRLAGRAMQRLNPKIAGSLVTTLSGLRAIGQRWVRVQYPFVSGLQDAVIEVQSAEVDLMAGRCTFEYIRIAPEQIEAYDPETDEGAPPIVPPPVPVVPTYPLFREDETMLFREDGVPMSRESA